MTVEVVFVDAVRSIERRAGKIDYRFQVKDGESSAVVVVRITGAFHDPASLYEERIEAASAWLKSRIKRQECNPFVSENPDTWIDLPAPVMEFWIEHRSIPRWL
jgi:hypothetical protein